MLVRKIPIGIAKVHGRHSMLQGHTYFSWYLGSMSINIIYIYIYVIHLGI